MANHDKVGSDPGAAKHFAEKNDFGIPAKQAKPGQQEVIDGSLDDRPLGTRLPANDPDGVRDTGVGGPDSGPGSFSGGDVDPDVIGVGSGTGISAAPVGHDEDTSGPDETETGVDNLADGHPAKGENNLPPGTHGASGKVSGTVNDRGDREVRMGQSPSDDALQHTDPDATETDVMPAEQIEHP
jgi:hypothetical protein